MNISWVTDHVMIQSKEDDTKGAIVGGAETTVDTFIKKGREQKHNIQLLDPNTINRGKLEEADLVILSSVTIGIKKTQFKAEDIDWIVENKKFIKIEHDATFCKFRNPECLESCSIRKCEPFWFRKMYKNAEKVIFLSPLQLKYHLRFFWKELGSKKYINSNASEIAEYESDWTKVWKDMKSDKVHCIPPCIKKGLMVPSEEARVKGTYCVVGAMYEGKGIRDILSQYESLGKNLRFIGPGTDINLVGAISNAGHTVVPRVPYSEMPSVLQKYEYIIISRRIQKQDNQGRLLINEEENGIYTYMNEGFARIIPEALGCGLKILVDKDSKAHIGCYSYGWSNEEIVDNCDTSDEKFWNLIGDIKNA